MYLLYPWSPLRFELGDDVTEGDSSELGCDPLPRMGCVIIAIWIEAHAHKAPSGSGSEITDSNRTFSGIRLIDESESECMSGSPEWVGARRTQVAGVFV